MIEIFTESILIVDDDVTFLTIVASYLENCGFTVYKSKNGHEAIRIFDEKNPDLILTDLYMPIMSGLELIEIFRKISPDTPVIVISGRGDINDAISTLRLGAWDYIIKPFSQNVLEQTVIRVIEKLRLIKENKKMSLELENAHFQLQQSFDQLKADQSAAEKVQQMLLPKPIAQFDDYSITYKVIPSLYLSGDFVDYFKINEEQIVFYIADVSGHGASSAFVTVLLKGFIEQMLTHYEMGLDDSISHPEKMLINISNELLKSNLGKYVTMIYCVLNVKDNVLTYSIGGHNPNPIIWDGKNATFLKGVGYAVGIYKNATFESYSCELPSQFTMLMLSDGIFEMMKGKSLLDNENILLSCIGRPYITIDKILENFGLKKDRGFPDDITLFMMRKTENGVIRTISDHKDKSNRLYS